MELHVQSSMGTPAADQAERKAGFRKRSLSGRYIRKDKIGGGCRCCWTKPQKSVFILVQSYRAMLSGLPSLLLRPSLHLLSPVSILFAHRSTVSEFVPCSHDDSKNSRGQDIHWNRKFRRRLQNILQSGNWDESFGRVRIVDLRAGSDGRDMTVRWSMDEEDFAAAVNSTQFHEICHIGMLLNRTAPTIRYLPLLVNAVTDNVLPERTPSRKFPLLPSFTTHNPTFSRAIAIPSRMKSARLLPKQTPSL
ncbi:hypothetical protein SprV_0602148300 [Sparganum proliferum]